jgi:hypothetical protein
VRSVRASADGAVWRLWRGEPDRGQRDGGPGGYRELLLPDARRDVLEVREAATVRARSDGSADVRSMFRAPR